MTHGLRAKREARSVAEEFTRQIYAQKCDAVYQHVFESYFDNGHSVYDIAA